MTLPEIIGLNVKWYRYQNKITQREYSDMTNIKIEYICAIEKGRVNLTCKNIETLANSFHIIPELLFNEKTAKLAIELPPAKVGRRKKEEKH